MKRFRFLKYVVLISLLATSLCWGAASDRKDDNQGRMWSYDVITKGPWVDVRAFMDGLSGRPTYATWYANQATTDVTTVIQTVLNSVDHTITGGSEIRLPNGIFLITSTLTMSTANATPWYNITMKGMGQGTELRWGGAAGGTILRTGILNNCHFEDIYFNGANLTDFTVYYGQIDGDPSGLCIGNSFKRSRFAYSKYGFGVGAYANTAGLLFELCKFQNNSYAGFAAGSLNTDNINFRQCVFSSNAFGVGTFLGYGASTTKTSLITGVSYTYLSGCYFKTHVYESCLFLVNTEADFYYEGLAGPITFIGCGGEGSRTFILDQSGFDGSQASSTGNWWNINLSGCYFNGFGIVTDSLNDPFIKIKSGSNLNITGSLVYGLSTAPRTHIINDNGHVKLQSTSFRMQPGIAAWPTILTYANNPNLREVNAENVIISRTDIGLATQSWLPPIFTFPDAGGPGYDVSPSVGGITGAGVRVPVYKTAYTQINTHITTFTDGTPGQEILIIFTDVNTTIVETDNIKLSAAFTSTANDTMRLVFDGVSWFEISRSIN